MNTVLDLLAVSHVLLRCFGTNLYSGRYSCVGKGFALRSLSYVIALLVPKYDVEPAAGEEGVKIWKDMKDNFAYEPGRLDLVFKLRKTD